MGIGKLKTYILPDPQHEYALSLIEAIYERYQLKPICLYLNRRDALFREPYFPELQKSDKVLAQLYFEDFTIPKLAAYLQQNYTVLGVLPYFEQAIMPMSHLSKALALDWNSDEVLQRFRDKYALKSHIKTQAAELELGYFRQVQTAKDVFAEPLPQKFILKPSDGFANRAIGFFNDKTTLPEIAAYFAGQKGSVVMEEQFDGTEYAVNGQMDATGCAHILNVTRYVRILANNKPNQYHRTIHVSRQDPAYAPLAAYAVQIMQVSGLKQAPFHLEVMLTAQGPRLIEVGARFGGTRYAYMVNDVHNNALNFFDLAGHYYLFKTPYPETWGDWAFYDQINFVHVDGISSQKTRMYSVKGVSQIEQLPQFRRWVMVPQLGAPMHVTKDLYTVPYSFHIMDRGKLSDLLQLADKIEYEMLQINQHVGTLAKLWVAGADKWQKTRFLGRLLRSRWQRRWQKTLKD